MLQSYHCQHDDNMTIFYGKIKVWEEINYILISVLVIDIFWKMLGINGFCYTLSSYFLSLLIGILIKVLSTPSGFH